MEASKQKESYSPLQLESSHGSGDINSCPTEIYDDRRQEERRMPRSANNKLSFNEKLFLFGFTFLVSILVFSLIYFLSPSKHGDEQTAFVRSAEPSYFPSRFPTPIVSPTFSPTISDSSSISNRTQNSNGTTAPNTTDHWPISDSTKNASLPVGVLKNVYLNDLKKYPGCWRICFQAPFSKPLPSQDRLANACNGDWLFLGSLATNSYTPVGLFTVGAFGKHSAVFREQDEEENTIYADSGDQIKQTGYFQNGVNWFQLYYSYSAKALAGPLSIGFSSNRFL